MSGGTAGAGGCCDGSDIAQMQQVLHKSPSPAPAHYPQLCRGWGSHPTLDFQPSQGNMVPGAELFRAQLRGAIGMPGSAIM